MRPCSPNACAARRVRQREADEPSTREVARQVHELDDVLANDRDAGDDRHAPLAARPRRGLVRAAARRPGELVLPSRGTGRGCPRGGARRLPAGRSLDSPSTRQPVARRGRWPPTPFARRSPREVDVLVAPGLLEEQHVGVERDGGADDVGARARTRRRRRARCTSRRGASRARANPNESPSRPVAGWTHGRDLRGPRPPRLVGRRVHGEGARGNPAVVVLNESDLSTSHCQQIAAELSVAETAFLRWHRDGLGASLLHADRRGRALRPRHAWRPST